MLYSKNGSIPKPDTYGTDGWIQVEAPVNMPSDGKFYKWDEDTLSWIEAS